MIQDRGDRRLDVLDPLCTIVVECRARGEPDINRGGITPCGARARCDARYSVANYLGQQSGAGDNRVADPSAQVQHLWPLGADRNRDMLTKRARVPVNPLRAALK